MLRSAVAELLPEAPLVWWPVGELHGFFLEEEAASRPLPADKVDAVMQEPPFWALLWPSGERLCRTLARHPRLVKDRSVLDFGSGCGLVACAAARAGARVLAVDSDRLALAACRLNASKNGVEVEALSELGEERVDLLLLADFLYDASHLDLFRTLCSRAEEILVVDSRLKELSEPGFELLGTALGQAVPDLDPHREFGRLRFWYRGFRRPEWEAALGLSEAVAR